jgi:glycosyltransferase involved in cell wall biosynthesis
MTRRSNDPKVVVSITPLPVRADSRTFKQASSVARLGYRSIVVEGVRSELDAREFLFELISVTDPQVIAKKILRERLKVLKQDHRARQHQLSVAQGTIAEHLRSCRHIEIDIALLLRYLDSDPGILELRRGQQELQTCVLNLQWRTVGWLRELKAAEPDPAENSIEGVDQLIETHDNRLKELYRELDDIAAGRALLIGAYDNRLKDLYRDFEDVVATRASLAAQLTPIDQLAAPRALADANEGSGQSCLTEVDRRVSVAVQTAAGCLNSIENIEADVAATLPRSDGLRRGLRVRGLWRVKRIWDEAWLTLRWRVWARCWRVWARCWRVWAGWEASEPNMFLRHLREYISRYVVAPLRVVPKASLYYMHSFYQFPAVYLLCLRHRAKFIYDAHDFYSQMHDEPALSHFWRHWVLPMERTIERACMRKAAAVVTVNEGIADLIERRFGRSAIVLRNAHDFRLEQPVERTIRDSVELNNDDFLVVCVGQFKQGMAIEAAIDGIAMLPPRYHLAFLGAGFADYSELLEKKNVAGRVHFLRAVAPAEVVPFIRSADAGMLLYYGVSPSIEHCLPNGFFQPIAAGLPILYPRLPEIARVADRYGIGVAIDPQNPASIAAGLQSLAEDAGLSEQVRSNIEVSRNELAWERDEAELRRLIEGVTGPASDGGGLSALRAFRKH